MRGFYVDVELARAARELVRREQAAINAEITALTSGRITTAGQVAKITAFVRERGHQLAGLTKRSVAAVLARGNPDENAGACSSFDARERAPPFVNSTRCSPTSTTTAACAARSDITAPPPGAGRGVDFNRKI